MFRDLTIRAALLRGFEDVVRRAGVNVTALLETVNIDRRYLQDPESRLSVISVCELLERASRVTGIGDFGIQVVMQQGTPDFGPLALLLREEPDVRTALQTLCAHLSLNTDAFDVRLSESGDDVILEQVFRLDKITRGNQLVELTCARLVQIVRHLISATWRPNLVCFSHPACMLDRVGYTLFRCPIEYGHDFTGIVLSPADLETRLNGANSDARRYAAAYLHSLKPRATMTFLQRVETIILGLLPSGGASSDRIAAQLGITRRTLNRKLNDHGHTYSSLLQSIRVEIARTLIAQSEKSLSEIGFELGFRSLSAFSVWFSRAFGAPPTLWRIRNGDNLAELRALPASL